MSKAVAPHYVYEAKCPHCGFEMIIPEHKKDQAFYCCRERLKLGKKKDLNVEHGITTEYGHTGG